MKCWKSHAKSHAKSHDQTPAVIDSRMVRWSASIGPK